VTAADRRRLAVLRNIRNVFDTADGIRLYESSSTSRTVRAEVEWLLSRHLVVAVETDDGPGYRATDAGRAQLDAWEAAT